MILGIFLYYIWVLLCALLSYIILRCTYIDLSFEERVRYPVWLYAVHLVVMWVPGVNIIGFIVYCFYINYLLYHNYIIKHFLFKKL